jgi:antitoxin component YwqK of YwqJK toxin-antitoxin module
MKLTLMLVLSLAVLSAYAQQPPRVIEKEQIQVRDDGLRYEVGVADPYTGTVVEYYSNGQKLEEYNYVNGVLHGVGTHWFEDGQKASEGNYVNGWLHGVVTEWDFNGQKRRETPYVNGKAEGVATYWDESGQKLFEKCFRDDREDKGWQQGVFFDYNEVKDRPERQPCP